MKNSSSVDELFKKATEMDKAGKSIEAARLYQKILGIEPTHAYSHYLLGIQALRRANYNQAIQLFQKAITHQPDEATFHYFMGQTYQAQGNLEQALLTYRHVLKLAPHHKATLYRSGTVLRSLGQLEEAESNLRILLNYMPNHVDARLTLGKLLVEQGNHEEALVNYNQLLKNDPNLVSALMRKGEILLARNRFDEAQKNYRELFTLQRGHGMNDALFENNTLPPSDTNKQPIQVFPFYIENLSEHINHLVENHKLDQSFTQASKLLETLLDDISDTTTSNKPITLSPDQAAPILSFYDRALYITDTPNIDGPAINTSLNYRRIEDTYLESEIPMVYFDDFLTPETLKAIYEYCLDATIFHRQSHNGFLSSYVYEGFNCEALYRIAAELRQRFPRILGTKELRNMWVYRQPPAGDGVRPHSDQSAVTVNFWVTPDSANLDPEHGGLIVYDREQPMDWDWYKTNQFKDSPEVLNKIDSFLQGANTTTIPYRENRAIMFHSNLFHASDCFTFKNGYHNRRMNITILFGNRS